MIIVTLSFVWLLMDEQGVEPVIAMAARNNEKQQVLVLEIESTSSALSYPTGRNVNWSKFSGIQTV